MKKGFILVLLIIAFTDLYGQATFPILGKLTDCKDNSVLIDATIQLMQNDSVLASTNIDEFGFFEFENLPKGTYELKPHFFYYPSPSFTLNIPNEEVVDICLSGHNPDSLLSSYTLLPTYTVYTFGLPMYSDQELNEVGKKYGAIFKNLGCTVDFTRYRAYDEAVNRLLIYRNGIDWIKDFKVEMEKRFQ